MVVLVTIALGTSADPDVNAAVARLKSLGHRVLAFARREYVFPDGAQACARGGKEEIRAYTRKLLFDGGDGVVVAEITPKQVPYLPWSFSRVLRDDLVEEVLITNHLLVRITVRADGGDAPEPRHSAIEAEICVSDAFREDARTLGDIASASRFDETRISAGLGVAEEALQALA